MSGRDQEPIAAFFPSIDRNLMRDLDRQLRINAAPDPAPLAEAPVEEAQVPPSSIKAGEQTPRPNTSDIIEAVEQAAASIAAMNARIQELEAAQLHIEATNTQLKVKLGELLQSQHATEAMARADADRAARAEHVAAQYMARAQVLEHDLETALQDLNKIAEAIAGTLGT